jgi:nicotinate-nucleotide adenylyltransferase
MATLFARTAITKQDAVRELRKMSKRIGIYAGAFDPVHTGHIAFAIQALNEAKLDRIYFIPERQPRHKKQVEHFAHRVAMLKQATKPHPQFKVLELVDINLSVERTLPKLQNLFHKDELVFLFGSDTASNINDWPKSDRLIKRVEIVIGLREGANKTNISSLINDWPVRPKKLHIIDSYAPSISSHKVREALRRNHPVAGVLKSVEKYSNKNWLYISLSVDKA